MGNFSEDERWLPAACAAEPLSLTELPSFWLERISKAVDRQTTVPHVTASGLNSAEWRMLALVGDLSPVGFARLAGVTTMDKSQVSRAVASIVKLGLVEKIKATPAARKFDLVITPTGEALFQRIIAEIREEQIKLLDQLTDIERLYLLRILIKIGKLVL